MKPQEWLFLTVDGAVIVIGLLHIYFLLKDTRKESQIVRITLWRFDRTSDVRKMDATNKEE